MIREQYLAEVAAIYPLPRAVAVLYLALASHAIIKSEGEPALLFLWLEPLSEIFSATEGIATTLSPLLLIIILVATGVASTLFHRLNAFLYDLLDKKALPKVVEIRSYIKEEYESAREFWATIPGDRSTYLVSLEEQLKAKLKRFRAINGWAEFFFIVTLFHTTIIFVEGAPVLNTITAFGALILASTLFARGLYFYISSVTPPLVAVRAGKGQKIKLGDEDIFP